MIETIELAPEVVTTLVELENRFANVTLTECEDGWCCRAEGVISPPANSGGKVLPTAAIGSTPERAIDRFKAITNPEFLTVGRGQENDWASWARKITKRKGK